MKTFDPTQHPHRRFNILTREWVICSPHRNNRPWQGQTETEEPKQLSSYDPKCYLCPGNTRASGHRTPNYQSTFFFENDFAAVNETEVKYDEPKQPNPLNSFLRRIEPVRGKCYVICFHPRHDLTMADLEPEQILSIIKTWTELYKKIPIDYPFIKYIKIFENKGSMMGCSNPHPHGQIWALSHIPTIPSKIIESQEDFANSDTAVPGHARMEDGRPSLLLAYAQSELNPIPSQRVIHQNKCFVALVPFWAVWPFEVIILPYKRHYPSLAHLQEDDQLDLANIIAHVTSTYDKLFQCSFPYSMAINQAPVNTSASAAQLHLSFSPPLLRSATVRKFLVGFELFGEAQRDLTPELAAERLRSAALNPHLIKDQINKKEGMLLPKPSLSSEVYCLSFQEINSRTHLYSLSYRESLVWGRFVRELGLVVVLLGVVVGLVNWRSKFGILTFCLLLIWVYLKLTKITTESVLIMAPLGIQLSTKNLIGLTSQKFIPSEDLCQAVIHESFDGWNLAFYLALIIFEPDLDQFYAQQVFKNIQPKLVYLIPVWKSIRKLLFEDH